MTDSKQRFSIIWSILFAGFLLSTTYYVLRNATPARSAPRILYVSQEGECGESSPCYSTIQQAVDIAASDDIIKVAQGIYTADGFRVLFIDKAITISGGYTTTNWIEPFPASQPTIIDAENVARRRVVHIASTSDGKITLNGLIIQRGNIDGVGAGVYVESGNVAIRDNKIIDNRTSGTPSQGGGIFVKDGELLLEKNMFSGNKTETSSPTYLKGSGGAVFAFNATLIMSDNIIQNNESDGNGGGVCTSSSKVTITHNIVLSNTADAGGGFQINNSQVELIDNLVNSNKARSAAAISLNGDSVSTLRGNTFEKNQSTGSAGGLHLSGNAILVNNIIQYNSTNTNGGAILQNHGTSMLFDNVINHNTAGGYGGAIWVNQGNIEIFNSAILSNTAGTDGGAIEVQGGMISLSGSEISYNQAKRGGAIFLEDDSVLVRVRNNRIQNNSASDDGGGIYVYNGAIELEGNLITNNIAGNLSGALYLRKGNVNAQNDIVADNGSLWEGVSVSGGVLSARHWTIANNGLYGLTVSGGSAVLTNTIIYSHTVTGLLGENLSASNSLFSENGSMCGGGAICEQSAAGNAAFVDAPNGNYHITENSDAINKGVFAEVLVDIDGEPRFGDPDLGADEYWVPGSLKRIYLAIVQK